MNVFPHPFPSQHCCVTHLYGIPIFIKKLQKDFCNISLKLKNGNFC